MAIYMIAIREDDPKHIREMIEQFNKEIEDYEDLQICAKQIEDIRAHYYATGQKIIRIKETVYVP